MEAVSRTKEPKMLPAAAVATALLLVETVSAYVSGSAAFLLRSRNPQVSRCSERVRALFAGGRLRIALARGASHTHAWKNALCIRHTLRLNPHRRPRALCANQHLHINR